MFWSSYVAGLSAGLVILSPAEWGVHKYMLHTAKRDRTFINRASSYAHHDVHHAAFMGPEHYYRDITNEHETIHFGFRDVLLILGIGAGAGFTGHKAYGLTQGDLALNAGDAGAAAGLMTAAAFGYAGYEISHHYMHVIGERRLAINRTLGDLLQEHRDGKLRFTKPLLDDICNAVEQHVDETASGHIWPVRYDLSLEDRFAQQVERNRAMGNVIIDVPFADIMSEVASQMVERERAVRAKLSVSGRVRYWLDRKVQRLFRGSDTWVGRYFRHIDNHHFLHHCNYTKNLNVFITWADKVFGTKLDSSRATLDTWQKKHLICPNSPDEEKFERT